MYGQIERVRQGKSFVVFAEATNTACKPTGDNDLATNIAEWIDDEGRRSRILPIGGEAMTPRHEGEKLFALLGPPPLFRRVPVALLDMIVTVFAALGRVVSKEAHH